MLPWDCRLQDVSCRPWRATTSWAMLPGRLWALWGWTEVGQVRHHESLTDAFYLPGFLCKEQVRSGQVSASHAANLKVVSSRYGLNPCPEAAGSPGYVAFPAAPEGLKGAFAAPKAPVARDHGAGRDPGGALAAAAADE